MNEWRTMGKPGIAEGRERRPSAQDAREPLGNDLGNAGAPVRLLGAGVAASEVGGEPSSKGAGLVDVFGGEPDGIAVAGGCAVVAPTRARAKRAKGMKTGEAIVRASAFGSNVNVTDADDVIHAGIAGAGKMVVTQNGEGHDAATALRYGECGIGEVIPCQTRVTLLHDVAGVGIDGEEGDACRRGGVSVDEDASVIRDTRLFVHDRAQAPARKQMANSIGSC